MNILIPIISGSEVRQFIWSNVASELIRLGNNVFVMIKHDDPELRNEISIYEPSIKFISFTETIIKKTLLSYLSDFLNYRYDKTVSRWRYSNPVELKRTKKYIYGLFEKLFFFFNAIGLLSFIEELLMQHFNAKNEINELLDKKINSIIVNNARFLYHPGLLMASLQMGVSVKVVYHSNKEVFAQPRINFPYSSYGVWNQEMLGALLTNFPDLSAKASIIGNTHFNHLITTMNPVSEMDSMIIKLRNDNFETRRTVLYTAAGVIVKNEYLYVKKIINILGLILDNFVVIIRINPMDRTDAWFDKFNGDERVIVQRPLWRMDDLLGINYTKHEDIKHYHNLLVSSDVIINIPSTVTIEAAIVSRPVINICFELHDVEITTNDNSILQFWNAPYYVQFHAYDFIHPVFDEKSLFVILGKIFNSSKRYEDFDKCINAALSPNYSNPNKILCDFILSE